MAAAQEESVTAAEMQDGRDSKKRWCESKQRVFNSLQPVFGSGGGRGNGCEDGWECRGSERLSLCYLGRCPWRGRELQYCGGKREGRYWRDIGGREESFSLRRRRRRRRQRRQRRRRTFDWHWSGIVIVAIKLKAVEEEE